MSVLRRSSRLLAKSVIDATMRGATGDSGATTSKARIIGPKRVDGRVPLKKQRASASGVKGSPIKANAAAPTAANIVEIKAVTTTSTAIISAPISTQGTDFIETAKQHLSRTDPRLGEFIARCPKACTLISPRGKSGSCFEALAKSIIYQQISGLAARAIYAKFLRLFDLDLPKAIVVSVDPNDDWGEQSTAPRFPTPSQVLSMSIDTLRSAGLSLRKAEYILELAQQFNSGNLSDVSLSSMSDEQVSRTLTSIRGIGQWTVDMFLMFHLHRPNVLPTLDLAVKKAMCQHFGVPYGKNTPKHAELVELAKVWEPYRSVAAWYMWQLLDTVTL
ncbi:hypothetical protein EV182_001016 [Spiromyces aspiralis]|uniref:Uncharacterized protein n=1 Tax=Spiromyces aspiralis TaxID=68401 RepID=A0ACC1HG68_9FUNG|nr:hypothetical protein EV182_001016 [Spiromyces aspiralis]